MKLRIFLVISMLIAAALMVRSTFLRPLILRPPQAEKDLDPTVGQEFSLIVLPDTQIYAQSFPETFCAQTEWIVEHKQTLNIQFVSQLGDIVNSGAEDPEQWKVASDCMAKLEGHVPYGIIPGNHDVDVIGDPYPTFKSYTTAFPLQRFYLYPWYRGDYLGNRNSYQTIHAGGQDWLFLNLEVDPTDDVLAWADKILKEHPNKKVILTTHVFLEDRNGQRSESPHFRENANSAEQIWEKLITPNCNVFLVLSGHFHQKDGENRLESFNSCGNTVHQVVQDYQSRERGGNGRLRIYTFRPNEQRINVQTYSPVTDTFEIDDDSQFSLNY